MSSAPQSTFNVGDLLPEELLALAKRLPVKPAPVELAGERVRLVPLEPERDAPALYAVSNGSPLHLGRHSTGAYDAELLIWRYMRHGPFHDVPGCEAYLVELGSAPDLLPLTVINQATDHPIGTISMMANSPAHLKIELGHIWISPVMQGSGVIYEACFLLLRHCFEMGYRRLEWKCDAFNERSRRTALNLGFRFEGVQEYHMIARGRTRDTAWFRILDHEWPHVRAKLEDRFAAHPTH
jgi:RimJ/RimL family protein N-acetyltransferase